jgi:hypothetical protein
LHLRRLAKLFVENGSHFLSFILVRRSGDPMPDKIPFP